MIATSRRSVLTLLSVLAGNASLWALRLDPLLPGRKPAAQTDPFPLLNLYVPITPGEIGFPRVAYIPSFLHPNRRWVALPNSTGGFDLWDWKEGVPLRSFGGEHPGERPSEPCAHTSRFAGCFCAEGDTWVHGKSWRGGDDGQLLMGTGVQRSASWSTFAAMNVQINPSKPVAYMTGASSDSPSGSVQEVRLRDGELVQVGLLPSSLGLGYFPSNMALSPDGRWALVRVVKHGGWSAPAWWSIWDVRKGTCRAYRSATESRVSGSPTFSVDGARAYLPAEGTPTPWDWAGVAPGNPEPSLSWQANTGGFGPSTVELREARVKLERRREGIIDVLSSIDSTLVGRLVAFPPNVSLAAFDPKGHLVVAAPPSGTPWLWNPQAPVRTIPGNVADFLERPAYSPFPVAGARAIAWSRDGRWVGIGDVSGRVLLYDAERFRTPDGTTGDEDMLNGALDMRKIGSAPIRSLCFSQGGLSAIDLDGHAAVWSHGRSDPILAWRAHGARANTIQFVEDGSWVVTGGLEGIRAWNLGSLTLSWSGGQSHLGVTCLHLEPRGQYLAAGFLDGWIGLYETRTGNVLWEGKAHSDVTSSVAIHPSRTWVSSLGWDGFLRQWDVPSGKAGLNVEAPTGGSCLEWSSNGQKLAVGGNGVAILNSSFELISAPATSLSFLWDEDCT